MHGHRNKLGWHKRNNGHMGMALYLKKPIIIISFIHSLATLTLIGLFSIKWSWAAAELKHDD